MNLQCGRDLFDQPRDANVLNDDGVHSRGRDCHDCQLGLFNFVIKNQGVESDESLYTSGVKRLDRLGKFLKGKPDFGSSRKMIQAKVYRVGARFDRGLKLRPVPGWAHEFRFVGPLSHRGSILLRIASKMAVRDGGKDLPIATAGPR